MTAPREPLRFADVLTTASAVANYLGQPDVTARHVLDAIEIQTGAAQMEDLGTPISPFLRRGSQAPPGADPAVRELAQRWFAALGNDINATLDDAQLQQLRGELRQLTESGS